MAGGLKADDARPCLLSHSVKLYLVWKHSRGSVKIMSYNGIFARISHVTSNSSKGQVRHVRRHFVFFFFRKFFNFYFFFFVVLFRSFSHASPCDAPPAYSPLPSRPRPQASLQFELGPSLFMRNDIDRQNN